MGSSLVPISCSMRVMLPTSPCFVTKSLGSLRVNSYSSPAPSHLGASNGWGGVGWNLEAKPPHQHDPYPGNQ